MNLYSYVTNDPVNFLDPYGLNTFCPTEGYTAAIIAALLAYMSIYMLIQYLCNIDWYIDLDTTKEDDGDYYRHYTSEGGVLGIIGTGQIYVSIGEHLEYGPGVYFTTPKFSPKDVRVTGSSGNYYIDVWVPRSITSKGSPTWNDHGGGQYTYGGGNYPVYNDPNHLPIPGKTP